VSNPAHALQTAMRAALLAHMPLILLLGGAHVHEEMPRGAVSPLVSFGDIETRDWSVADAKAHEHFVTLSIRTNSRSRKLAQDILDEIEAVLDNADLTLDGHRLVNLRLTFWSVTREKNGENFGAALRFRAATEPL
jgi:hypothetical protein